MNFITEPFLKKMEFFKVASNEIYSREPILFPERFAMWEKKLKNEKLIRLEYDPKAVLDNVAFKTDQLTERIFFPCGLEVYIGDDENSELKERGVILYENELLNLIEEIE